MFLRTLAATALLTLSTYVLADKTSTFVLEPTHTQVRFQWDHFGFSTPGANFNAVAGEITINETYPDQSSVSVQIPVKSLHTHVPALDEHLLTDNAFFKPKEFPYITYVSNKISNLDLEEKSFELEGDITINGITKPVTLYAKIAKTGSHPMWNDARAIGINATTKLLRSDFNMDAYAPYVSDELQVSITLEAIEKKDYMKALEQKNKN